MRQAKERAHFRVSGEEYLVKAVHYLRHVSGDHWGRGADDRDGVRGEGRARNDRTPQQRAGMGSFLLPQIDLE